MILNNHLWCCVECETSHSNKATLSQSDLILMFFVSYNALQGTAFAFGMQNKPNFTSLFNALVLKNMATGLDHD